MFNLVINSIDGESENLEEESDKDNFSGKSEDESSTESESDNETIISQYVNYESKENLEEIESNITFKIEYLSKNKSTDRKKNNVNNCRNEEYCGSSSPRPTDATLEKKVFAIENFFVCWYSALEIIFPFYRLNIHRHVDSIIHTDFLVQT